MATALPVPVLEAAASVQPPSKDSVPRLLHSDPRVGDYLRRGEPVVIVDCPLARSLANWSMQHIADNLESCEPWPVHVTPRCVGQNVFARVYASDGLGRGTLKELSFETFARSATEPSRDENYYCQALLMWAKSEHGGGPAAIDRGGGPTALNRRALGRTLDAELDGMDMDWLRWACGQLGNSELEALQFWCSHGEGATTPLHYDASDNFLTQIRGSKQCVLFPPRDSFDLYPFPIGHPMDGFSMAGDLTLGYCSRLPALATAVPRGRTAVLGEGDCLWLPKYWWHLVRQPAAAGENMSVNAWLRHRGELPTHEWLSRLGAQDIRSTLAFWLGAEHAACREIAHEIDETLPGGPISAADARAPPSTAMREATMPAEAQLEWLHAARMAESAATAVCGASELGGRLLAAMAVGADHSWPESSRARAFAAKLRDELARSVGGTAGVDRLLELITRHGRLSPGLAPPIAGKIVSSEPLPPKNLLLPFYAPRSRARAGLQAMGAALRLKKQAEGPAARPPPPTESAQWQAWQAQQQVQQRAQ